MTPSEEKPVDPRDNPAPFGATVVLTAMTAAFVMAVMHFLPEEDFGYGRFFVLGPFGLVFFEIINNEVWWRRWWGLAPGVIIGAIIYFEGQAFLLDLIGETWAEPVAYVAGWTALAAVFAYASNWPRTDFSAALQGGENAEGGKAGEAGPVTP